jgi:small subunit ribosomal protein S13
MRLTGTNKQKSLETFFGVGNHTSSRLLARFNIHPTCRVGELANKQVLDLTAVLSDMKIENDLRREVLNDIKRLKETGTYRGRRHALGLPVRGQRTRTQVGLFLPSGFLSFENGYSQYRTWRLQTCRYMRSRWHPETV